MFTGLNFLMYLYICICCYRSVSKLCLTLCNPMDCSTPAFPPSPLSLGVCSNSRPLSCWCHPTISSSVTPFSFCPQSYPASGSFPMGQLFASGGQRIRTSVSASVISPSNEYTWLISFRIDWFDFLVVQGTLKSLHQHHFLFKYFVECKKFDPRVR